MIIFNYQISDFINNVQILSQLRSNSRLAKGDENELDDTSITDDEEALVKKYLRAGCAEIADILSGYTNDLLDTDEVTELEAFEFDVTYLTVENSIVFRVNMPTTFRTSAMKLIDEAIKDALENYLLYRVARHKTIEEKTYTEDCEKAKDQIRSYLTRRTGTIKRVYKLF